MATPAGATALERRWRPAHPTDLDLLLSPLRRGPGDPSCRRDVDGTWWRASRTPVGPGTLRVATAAGGEVHATGWGPGADWLLDRIPALLGADDPAEDFRPRHRALVDPWRRHPGLRIGRTGLLLEALLPTILEQKVTTDEAYRGWRLLLWRHGEPAPGVAAERMRVMPDPAGWRHVPSWEWHRAGVDAKRSGTALRVAALAGSLERFAERTSAEAARALRGVPGVGPWTVAETLQRSHGDADAVTVGDLHLPHTVGWVLGGGQSRRTDDAEMLRMLEPYAGHRHRACRLVLLAGRRPPRRVPRYAPRDFRTM